MGYDFLGLALWLGISVVFALLAILFALLLSLMRRRWIWACALVAAVALGYLGPAESTSDVAHTAESLVFGSGTSLSVAFIAEFALVLLVSLFALVSVLVEARRFRRR
ncbi:MAG TPA: hypothetical protein VJR48_05055 [Ktedonobacterales bacterium]|nr:hypothetical protein [Ktedonobacterales bacterium]